MGTEANSSTCNALAQTCAGYCVFLLCIISASGGLPVVCSEDLLCMHSLTVVGKYFPLRFLIKNLGCENMLLTFKGNFIFLRGRMLK